MSKRDEFEPLQGALAAALGGIAHRGAPQALAPLWQLVAGASAAAASRPSHYAQGTLVIETDSPAWLHALQQQEAVLVARLREQLPGFARLELRLRWGTR